jgi:hypothetical protein
VDALHYPAKMERVGDRQKTTECSTFIQRDKPQTNGRMLCSLAETFAELRAEKAPNRPLGSSLLH